MSQVQANYICKDCGAPTDVCAMCAVIYGRATERALVERLGPVCRHARCENCVKKDWPGLLDAFEETHH